GEAVLSVRVTLVSGFAVPAESLSVVLRDALAVGIHEGEAVLSVRVALVSGFAVPAESFGIVLRHSLPVGTHTPELGLSFCVTLFGAYARFTRGVRQLLPLNRLSPVHPPSGGRQGCRHDACSRDCHFPRRFHRTILYH